MLLRPWYLPHATIYQAPDGDGSGGGGGDNADTGSTGDQGDQGDKPDPRIEALEGAVKTLAQGNAAVNDALAKLAQGMEQLAQNREKPEDQGSGRSSSDEDVDLETMDRKQFAAYLLSQQKGVIEAALKPLGDRFGQLDSKIDAHGLSVMIKDFQKDHPDFFEWKTEMRDLLKDNPTLTPARAYALVRGENPDKAKGLDKKYGLFKESKENRNGTDLLSLFPTGSGSATKGNAKMSPQQAAEAAWDEVMSNLRGS